MAKNLTPPHNKSSIEGAHIGSSRIRFWPPSGPKNHNFSEDHQPDFTKSHVFFAFSGKSRHFRALGSPQAPDFNFRFFEKQRFYLTATVWITGKSLVLKHIRHLKSIWLTWFQKVKKAVKKWKSVRSENFSSVSALITFGWNRGFGTRSESKMIQIWLLLRQNWCDWSDHSRKFVFRIIQKRVTHHLWGVGRRYCVTNAWLLVTILITGCSLSKRIVECEWFWLLFFVKKTLEIFQTLLSDRLFSQSLESAHHPKFTNFATF